MVVLFSGRRFVGYFRVAASASMFVKKLRRRHAGEGTVVPGGYSKSRLRRTGMRCGKPGREAVTSGCCSAKPEEPLAYRLEQALIVAREGGGGR